MSEQVEIQEFLNRLNMPGGMAFAIRISDHYSGSLVHSERVLLLKGDKQADVTIADVDGERRVSAVYLFENTRWIVASMVMDTCRLLGIEVS